MATPAFQLSFAGKTVDRALQEDVVSLAVDESSSKPATCRIELAARMLDDGSWHYVGDERFSPFTPVSVQLGFAGKMQTVFSGYVTGVELALGAEPEESTLAIDAMDTCVLMSLDEKTATFPDLSDEEIATSILLRYCDSVSSQSTPAPRPETEFTPAQRGNDLRFVRQLAERNGFEFSFETDALLGVRAFFRAPQLGGTPQPDLTVQMGDDSNLERLTVAIDAQRPSSVAVTQLDVAQRKVNAADATAVKWKLLGAKRLEALASALGTKAMPNGGRRRMLALGPPTADPNLQNALAQGVRNRAGWFVNANGEVNAEAYENVLRPRRPVLVRGAGKTFSGAYYVTRVQHQIDGEGMYAQRFEGVRNATGLAGNERFGARAAAVVRL